MFKIYGDAEVFNQWAMDYALTNEHMVVGDRVSFRTATGNLHVMYAYNEGGTVMVNVPNRLLQQDERIIVNLAGHPGCQTIFDIIPGEKPEGYDDLYVASDRHDPSDLVSRVAALEAGGGSGGVVVFTVDTNGTGDYENGIYTCNKTFDEAVQILKNGGFAILVEESSFDSTYKFYWGMVHRCDYEQNDDGAGISVFIKSFGNNTDANIWLWFTSDGIVYD